MLLDLLQLYLITQSSEKLPDIRSCIQCRDMGYFTIHSERINANIHITVRNIGLQHITSVPLCHRLSCW